MIGGFFFHDGDKHARINIKHGQLHFGYAGGMFSLGCTCEWGAFLALLEPRDFMDLTEQAREALEQFKAEGRKRPNRRGRNRRW